MSSPKKLNQTLRRFLLVFTPALIVITAFSFFIYRTEAQNRLNEVKINEAQVLKHYEQVVQKDITLFASDILTLLEHHELHKYLQTPDDQILRDLHNDWAALGERKGIYDQVRFIDSSGAEQVRINFPAGKAQFVAREDLQDKSKRYYFTETFQLGRNEIFISPLDLNIEHGKIEQPHKSMLRIGAPVFDRGGEKRGIVLINVYGAHILDHLGEDIQSHSKGQTMLANVDGFWLHHPLPEKEWGFMIGKRNSFDTDFPGLWHHLKAHKTGQIVTEKGLLTYTTIHPASIESNGFQFKNKNYYWKAITFVPTSLLNGILAPLKTKLVLYFFALTLVFAFGSWSIARAMVARDREHAALTESEERLRLAAEITGLGVWEHDLFTGETAWSEEMCQIFGVPHNMPTHKESATSTEEDTSTLPSAEELFANSSMSPLQPGQAQNGGAQQFTVKRADGTTRDIAGNAVVIMDNDGNPQKMLGALLDITRQKQAERKLNESRQNLKKSQQIAQLGSWTWEIASGKLEWSDETYRILGVDPDAITPMYDTFLKCTHPEDKVIVESEIAKALEGKPYNIDHRVLLPNGEIIYVHAQGKMEFDAAGKPTQMSGTIIDITRRKRVEEALRKSKKRYRSLYRQFETLLENIDDIIVFLDKDLETIWSNQASRDMLCRSSEQHCFLNKTVVWKNCSHCLARNCVKTGEVQERELADKDGRTWQVRAFPVLDHRKNVVNVIVIAHDISERLRIQSENIRTSQLASLGEMAAGVAHEINNPITGVINYAQLLYNRYKDEQEIADMSIRIVKEGNRVAQIVSNLLQFARNDDQEAILFDISESIKDVLFLIRKQLDKEEINLSFNIPANLPPIFGHNQQIQQAVLNIINNSRYALKSKTPENGGSKKIEIEASAIERDARPMARLTFTDYGIGIPARLLPRILTPFITTKPAGVGTGLGLSICHDIIKKHNGFIDVESVEGEYTIVTVDLPLATDVEVDTFIQSAG